MAKINHILFGQGKGKVGGLVLQRYEGMNIVREKPISVKNPQSEAQTTQRGKLKLASQITAQFSYVLIQRLAKVSIYNRTKRAAAVKAIIDVITAAQPDSPELLVSDILNAINAKSVADFVAPTFSTPVSGSTNLVAASGDTVFTTIVDYDAEGHFVNKTDATFESDGTAKQYTVTEKSAVVMAVSLRAVTDSGRATLANAMMNVQVVGWTLDIARSIATGDILVSGLAGAFLLGV